MGLFSKPAVAVEPAAEDSFVLADTLSELQVQRRELEKLMTREVETAQFAIYKSRFDYVNDKIRRAKGNGTFAPETGTPEISNEAKPAKAPKQSKRTRVDHPWEWPGPIAPPGMKAVKLDGNTYSHVSTTEPEHQTEDATEYDYKKVVAWAERMHWTAPIVAAHWGALVERGTPGPLYTKTKLMLLCERIKKISADKFNQKVKEQPEKMGIFDKPKAEAPPPTKEEAIKQGAPDVVKQIAADVVDLAKQQDRANAHERLLAAGLTMYKKFETRDEAEEILKHRTMAILELGVIYEQFEKAKKRLESFIEDISLVFDPALEAYFLANNPTGKKTWSLQYGDLKVANKPQSVALDTERDFDESLFQAWCRIQLEKNPELAKRLDIRPLTRYSRNMKEFAAWYKEQQKPPAVPGIRHQSARENVFSIAPSLETAKDKIKDSLKEKGLR